MKATGGRTGVDLLLMLITVYGWAEEAQARPW
jgi:hypothetical protein